MEGMYRHGQSSLHLPPLFQTASCCSVVSESTHVKFTDQLLCSAGEGMKGSDEAMAGQATSLLRFAWGYVFEAPMGTLGFIEIR